MTESVSLVHTVPVHSVRARWKFFSLMFEVRWRCSVLYNPVFTEICTQVIVDPQTSKLFTVTNLPKAKEDGGEGGGGGGEVHFDHRHDFPND